MKSFSVFFLALCACVLTISATQDTVMKVEEAGVCPGSYPIKVSLAYNKISKEQVGFTLKAKLDADLLPINNYFFNIQKWVDGRWQQQGQNVTGTDLCVDGYKYFGEVYSGLLKCLNIQGNCFVKGSFECKDFYIDPKKTNVKQFPTGRFKFVIEDYIQNKKQFCLWLVFVNTPRNKGN